MNRYVVIPFIFCQCCIFGHICAGGTALYIFPWHQIFIQAFLQHQKFRHTSSANKIFPLFNEQICFSSCHSGETNFGVVSVCVKIFAGCCDCRHFDGVPDSSEAAQLKVPWLVPLFLYLSMSFCFQFKLYVAFTVSSNISWNLVFP